MTNKPLLTIGIPTYNRKEVIAEHVKGLIDSSVQDSINILIIDNDSPDGTFEHLKDICDDTNIRVLKNLKNLGITGSCIRLFKECQTEYLLLTSDEDPIIPSQLDSLVTFLHKNKPLFVSTQFFHIESIRKKLYRGREKISSILPNQIQEASAYMSGLVYKVEESKQALADIKFHIEQPGQVYPLVLLSGELLMHGTCLWWDKPLTEEKYRLPTYINDPIYGKYYYLPARWYQHKLFVDFYEDRIKTHSDPEMKKIAKQMLQFQQKNLIQGLRSAIEFERPDMLSYFDQGIIFLYFELLLTKVYKKLNNHYITRIIFRKPLQKMYHLYKQYLA